jgi:superfamily II DNA or RNA helicase
MSSFSQFLASFDTDPGKRGRQFEHFVKWFLTTDPEWSTQVAKVWLWEEWAGRWGRDCGIDLVFEHRNGTTWAVQAKCYAPDYEVTKSDVDKFLSETSRKAIDHRLLIATTDMLGANARQVCEGQEKPVVRYLLSDFEKASVDYPESLAALATGKRKPPPQPRPYQIEAIGNVAKGFETADRGQLLMACGTGKTLVSMWIKERLDARPTLVLVPSLGLLSQIVSDWTSAANVPFDVLCVCSDQTVGKREEDEAVTSVSELPFPVTGDTAEIAQFLKGDGHRVVFSTYQSSPLIEAAQADQSVPAFDLILADEAHRCAGKVDGAFATVLDGKKLRGAKRLFATATPRTYSSSLKAAADEVGVDVVGMDDEEVFGRPLHTLSFGEAIERNLLTDYQVVIVGVDDAMIAEWIKNRRIVGTETGIETDAQVLATQIGLIKAIKDYGLQRIISFHNRVKRAEEFAREIPLVLEWLSPHHKPSCTITTDHVSGAMSAIARRQKLSRLKQIGEGEVGILSNAKCLSEGVDVPALDGVAFVDPRSSQIDIVQAVGRAIRLSKDKTKGTIVIPVFIEHSDDPEQAILSSNFKPIWQILDALKAHDNVLSSQLDQFRIEMGSGTRKDVGASELHKIVFDLPTSVSKTFAESLRTQLVEQTTETWMFWYGQLGNFVHQSGHCLVPRRYITSEGHRLGQWVLHQRQLQAGMPPFRKTQLDELGFVWDPFADQWDKYYERLLAYCRENGHCRVPARFKTPEGLGLGAWVSLQRKNRQTLDEVRKARLDALGFTWLPFDEDWEAGLRHLNDFFVTHGHSSPSQNFASADGYKLGNWVSERRAKKEVGFPERKVRLDALGFVWDPYDEAWERGYQHLKTYAEENGHALVPNGYVCEDGHNLGVWVSQNRSRKNKLTADRKHRLDDLGFDWDPFANAWEVGFLKLEEFLTLNGHCRVPKGYKCNDGYLLFSWVRRQRNWRNKMTPQRKSRLDALGFVWEALPDRWDVGLKKLSEFVRENGHCRVDPEFKCPDGFRLGGWVARQRGDRNELPIDRRKDLEAMGFLWDLNDEDWESGFQHLMQYQTENGNSLVPSTFKSADGYRLGSWVNTQRTTGPSMSPDRKGRLDSLGFVWDVLSHRWEEGYRHLRNFVDATGHCLVPAQFCSSDQFQLGRWVSRQRGEVDKIADERKARLDALGFVWDVLVSDWEQGYQHLSEFRKETGHTLVPAKHRCKDGFNLGGWVVSLRSKQEKVSLDRKARLNALGFVWDVLSTKWEEGFARLKEFHLANGHCRVPHEFKSSDGYGLGYWVLSQRQCEGAMPPDRKSRLDAIGFVWDPTSEKWEVGYRHLADYVARFGNAEVPTKYRTETGYSLGQWVANQRADRNSSFIERKQRLDALGFVWQVGKK